MLKLGKVVLNNAPRIAVAFGDKVKSSAIMKVKKYGVDVAELRIDRYAFFFESYVLKEVNKFKKFPTIATIRSRKEGGNWKLSEKERLRLFKKVIPKVDAIDIELSSSKIIKEVISESHQAKKKVIVSYHNFKTTPSLSDLNKRIVKAKKLGADIVKIAAFVRKNEHMKVLATLTLKNAEKNLITIGMGSQGALSRVFFPALGSLLTYASVGGKSTAPGQLDYVSTSKILRQFYSK